MLTEAWKGYKRDIYVRIWNIYNDNDMQHVKTENEEAQACAKQSEENDSLEQQLKDAQYTLTESENK